MEHDYKALMWEESASIADLLDELPDEAFDQESLCGGWQVRDVIGHMITGHTTPMPKVIVLLAKYKFNIPKGSYEMSKVTGHSLTPAEIRTTWRGVASNHTRKGISMTVPWRDGFVDHLIHQQDIRRPLGQARVIPENRLRGALDALPVVNGPMFKTKQTVAGLRLKATDIDWTHGDGPEVSGTGEALVMAVGGRAEAMAELSGDGVDTLKQRLAS